ncbi:MAG: hypothetical protein QXV73_03940 [Candidatus Micrarchaeia archaeon]
MKTKEKIIIRDRFGELNPEPDFVGDKVVFYKVVNPQPSMREGEKWVIAPVSIAETGKKDKRGNPIFICRIKLLQRVEWLDFDKAVVSPEGIWEVPVFSGDVFIENRKLREERREVVEHISNNLIYFPQFYYILKSYLQSHGEIVDRISFFEIAQGKTKEWLTPEHVKKAFALYEQYKAFIEQEQKKEQEKEAKIASAIAEGSKIELSEEAIISLFLLNSINTILKGDTLWDSVFDVGGVRFQPAPTTEDSDFPVPTSSGEATGKIKYILNSLAKWAWERDAKYLLNALGVKAPKPKTIWQEKIRLSFSSYRGIFERYTTEAEARVQLEPKLDEAIQQVKVEPIIYTFPHLTITFNPIITSYVKREIDLEEGIGAKDATWYENTYLVAKIGVDWECNLSFGELHPEVINSIKEALQCK